jgi:hypothetical protein
MKKLILAIILLSPCCLFAQIGIKAGLNYAKISKASDINSGSKTGFHVGLFRAPPSKNILSHRSEILFSRQGYNYKKGTSSGDVKLDYIQMGQLASINATKYLSLLFGAQAAYLISAQVDSSNGGTNTNTNQNILLELYNRKDYGYAVGFEVHPVAGLIIGARYNVSLGKIYESLQTGQRPSFTSEDAKNNVIQLSVGWRFGKNANKKDKKDQE